MSKAAWERDAMDELQLGACVFQFFCIKWWKRRSVFSSIPTGALDPVCHGETSVLRLAYLSDKAALDISLCLWTLRTSESDTLARSVAGSLDYKARQDSQLHLVAESKYSINSIKELFSMIAHIVSARVREIRFRAPSFLGLLRMSMKWTKKNGEARHVRLMTRKTGHFLQFMWPSQSV